MLLVGVTLASSPRPLEKREPGTVVRNDNPGVDNAIVLGTAWKADNTPLAEARVRLRDVQTGTIVANTIANANGEFRFDGVDDGAYIIELVTDRGWVRAIGKLFGVKSGRNIATSVRLSGKVPWFPGFFGNAAADAVMAASRVGVTAIGSNGQPASPQ